MSEIVERLRGIYRIPINDGLGATGGGEEPDNPNEFVRHFETSPILTAIKTAAIAKVEGQFDAMTGKQRTALWHAVGNAVDASASPQPNEPAGVTLEGLTKSEARQASGSLRILNGPGDCDLADKIDRMALSGPRS